MKKNIYLAILAIVTMVCVVVGLVFRGFGGSLVKFPFWKSVTVEQTEWKETLEEFSTVRMDLAAADVVVERGGDFTIAYTGDSDLEPDYSMEGSALKITNGKNYKKIHAVSACAITVTVPEDVSLEELKVAIDAGELQINGIAAGNLKAELNAGNLEVSDGDYAHVSADVDAGNVTFDNCTVTETNAEVNMGNIAFKNCAFDGIEVTSDMGNVEIHSSQPLDGYRIRMSADLGNLTVNGKNYSGSYNVDGDAEHYVDLSVDLGNAELTD